MSHKKLLPEHIFYGSVKSRLEVGHTLFRDYGSQLMHDSVFQHEFRTLQEYASAVNSQMTGMDLGPLCTHCSSRPNGGCCSLTIAAETDAIQICLNLLTGVDVRYVRDDGNECVFLGKTGCIFIFKPIFCLNYNCRHIRESVTAADLGKLEQLTGRLLTKQYEIEQHILSRIQCRK